MNANQKAALTAKIESEIHNFSIADTHLAGLQRHNAALVLAKQVVDSIRRVQFVERVARLPIQQSTSDPTAQHFDPVRAAVYQRNQGNFDEACWLVFLAIHCGKHLGTKWLLASELYGSVDPNNPRTWQSVTSSPHAFSNWLGANSVSLQGKFGNHRKYESNDPNKRFNTGEVVDSYVAWVGANQGHHAFFQSALAQVGGSPTLTFAHLYDSMDQVYRFGRTGKFDYLTMLAKLGLVNIEPDKAYLSEATGPKKGIRLLLTNNPNHSLSSQVAESVMARLGASLSIPSMTMQVMEDAICNWQKSPEEYTCFRG